MRRGLVLVVVAVVAGVGAPPVAEGAAPPPASQVRWSALRKELSVTAQTTVGGANNVVAIVESGAGVMVREAAVGGTLFKGKGCTQVDVQTVTCPLPKHVNVSLGFGDDFLIAPLSSVVPTTEVWLHTGNDKAYMGASADVLHGRDGDDTLVGGAGNDYFDGATGRNVLDGGPGADVFNNRGADQILYKDRPTWPLATFGDGANDGEAGEGDDVMYPAEIVRAPFNYAGDLPAPGSLFVDRVWSGAAYRFDIETRPELGIQAVGYYDANGMMTVAIRRLNESTWTKKTLPTLRPKTFDSHDHIEIGFDPAGYLHYTGNMHITPLQYFRTAVPVDDPADVLTMHRPASMPVPNGAVTYPVFGIDGIGRFTFSYRNLDGVSWNYHVRIFYSETLTWHEPAPLAGLAYVGRSDPARSDLATVLYPTPPRLLGIETYFLGQVRSLDPRHHCGSTAVWVGCRGMYVRTTDYSSYRDVKGTTLPQPMTTESLLATNAFFDFDPNGGITGLSMVHDTLGHPIITYTKYESTIDDPDRTDEAYLGRIQAYVAHWDGTRWVRTKFSNWNRYLPTDVPPVFTGVQGPHFDAAGTPHYYVSAASIYFPDLRAPWAELDLATHTLRPAPEFQPPSGRCGPNGPVVNEFPNYVHPEFGAKMSSQTQFSGRSGYDLQARSGDESGDYYFLHWEGLEDTVYEFGGSGEYPTNPTEPPSTRLTVQRTACWKY